MLESYSRCWTEIDYDAIAHNVEEIQKLVGDTKIMGIVKANAYGHGDVECAKALQKAGVDFFGVSSVHEALHLRQNGIQDSHLDPWLYTAGAFSLPDGRKHHSVVSIV